MRYIIATTRLWYEDLAKNLSRTVGEEFLLIRDRMDLSLQTLKTIEPRYVFFPHWSYIIPAEIHENFECVIFHMTDVPFGRGGSPLQNLIACGIYETKISALKCTEEIDAGPVYLQHPFSLHGAAEEIYLRAAKTIEGMIATIVKGNPIPVHQEGKIVMFKRRKPEEGDISLLTDLQKVFDYIRMLDAEGYPNAFLETEHFRFEFKRASLRYGKIVSDVEILPKEKKS